MKKIHFTVLEADDNTHSVVQNDKSCNNVEVMSDGKEKELMGSFDKNAAQVEAASKIAECCTVKAESSENTGNSVGGNSKQQEKKHVVTDREKEQEVKPPDSSEQTSRKIKLTDEEAEEPLKSSDIGGEQSDQKITDKQLTSSEEVLENKNISVPKDETKMCVVSSDNDIVRNDFDIKKSSGESDKCASTKSQENADSSVSFSSAVSVETGIKSLEDNSKCSEMNLHCPESEVSNSNLICRDIVKNGISESRDLNSSDRDSEKCTEVLLKNEKTSISINSDSEIAAISLNNVPEDEKEVCKDLNSLNEVSDVNCVSLEKHESAAVTSEHIPVLPEKNSASSSIDTSDISENNVLVNVANEKLSAKASDESSKSKCDSANAEKNKSLPKTNEVLADSNSDMPDERKNKCQVVNNNSESHIENDKGSEANKEVDVPFKNSHIKPAVEDIDSSKKASLNCAENKIEKELESKINEGNADCIVSDGQLSKKCELPNIDEQISAHESEIHSASKKDSFQADIKESLINDTCSGKKEININSNHDSGSKNLESVSDLTDAVENKSVVSDHVKSISELDNENKKSTSSIQDEVKESSAPVTCDVDNDQTDIKNDEEVEKNKSILLEADNKMNGDKNDSSESGVRGISTSAGKGKLSDIEEISVVNGDKTSSVQADEKNFEEVNKIKKVSKKVSGKSNKKGVKSKSKKVASDQNLEKNSDCNKSPINSNSEQNCSNNDLEKSCKNLVVSIVDAKISGMADMPALNEPCLDETDKKVPMDKDTSEDSSVKCNESIKVEEESEKKEMPEVSININRISAELSTPVIESKRKCRKPRRRARWDVRRSRKKSSKTACKDKPVSVCKEIIIENSNESVLEIPSCDTKPKSKGSKSSLEKNKASADAAVVELNENSSFEKEEDISLAVIKESLKSPRNSESKCNLKVPNLRISVRDMYDIYIVMNNICLETKFKHPSYSNSASVVSNESSLYVKSDQISGLSFDTMNDEVIPIDISSASPVKKKKGRLRPKGPDPTPKESKVPVLKSSVKTPAKSAKKRNVNNSKKLSDANEDQFSIPEGFLEILGNAENDLHSSSKEPARKSRRSADLSVISLQSSEGESTPRKRSRRIQEQHQKKISELAVEMEREQRMLEQLAKKSNAKKNVPQKTPEKTPLKAKESKKPVKTKLPPPVPEEIILDSKRATRKMNSRSRNMTKMTLMYEDESKDSEFSTSRDTDKSKKRRKGRGTRKGFRPWDVSSESSSSIEELTEEEEEEEHEEPLVFEVNEDEFACEEVEEDAEPVVIRRARTAKKTSEGESEEPVVIDDKPCSKCGKYDRPEWILLCDKCDNGYHTSCLIPPLMLIPDGDWFCQPCEHMFLCECLQNELQKLETVLKQKEREELRKQRLAYVGISLDNVLKPEKKEKSDESSKEDGDDKHIETKRDRKKDSSDDERQRKLYGKRSVRARRNVNYQFKEYDELIASAIQEEMLGVKLAEEAFKEAEEGADDDNDSDKSFAAKIPKTKTRKRRSKKLNDLDFTDDDEDSGEEYKGLSTDSEHTPPPSSNESDPESGVSGEWRIVRTRGKARRKVRRRRGRDSSDEEWDEEGSDTYRPVTRRAAQKNISYRELSSDEGEEEWQEPKPKKTPKRRKAASSEESEASFKETKPKKKPKVRKWVSSDSESEKSMSSSEESESSQESEDQWKVNKSCEGNRIKLNINKKAISSEDDDESTSRESVPRKRVNKIVSDESEEEESSSEDDKQDSAEDDDENSSKQVVKDKSPTEKESAKEVSVKSVEPEKLLKRDIAPNVLHREPIRETVTVVTVRDKAPLRIVKKEATKMVPCVIPYDKSPKSGHGTTPEEESDKEVPKEKESLPLATKAPGPSNVSQPNLPVSQTFSINKTPAVIQPTPERKPFTSTIMEPFSNIDEGDDSDDEVPLERIPTTCVPNPHPNKSAIYEREAEYTPAKELPGFSYTAPEEKCFPPSYTSLAPFQDYSSRPSPLKPSLVETYPSNSSPSKLTPLDTYSQNSSPKGFISLDSYSEARKKKHFYGNPSAEPEAIPRPVPPPVDSYQGEIRFPPEPYPCPPSPNTYSNRSPPHVQRDPGTPPRLYSQFPDAYAPPRSPEYYQNHQYYASEERIPRPSYQPNYAPPEQVPPFISNPYVATPVPQPNGGFMIDTLLRARNPENEEDELTGVTDIVSYITQE
ncbi:Remodeling and spacing factor 1, partial [Stegodyphus mimosarum]